MRRAIQSRRRIHRERGYALLMVVFVMTLMLIGVLMAAPNLYTRVQREKEEELKWRGHQYVRGIKLFYRKTGRFPSSLEDLTKQNLGVRVMRKAYADPMNTKDGTWRRIYVGPGGALIGSMNPDRNPVLLPVAGGTAPGLPGAAPSPPGTPASPNPPAPNPDNAAPGAQMPAAGLGLSSGPVIGGNIIGVGSKINRASIKVYENGRKYIEWEFIWDPAKDAAAAIGQPGRPAGAPIGQPIAVPPGQPPLPNPPPPQNPNPNQF